MQYIGARWLYTITFFALFSRGLLHGERLVRVVLVRAIGLNGVSAVSASGMGVFSSWKSIFRSSLQKYKRLNGTGKERKEEGRKRLAPSVLFRYDGGGFCVL